MQCKGSKGKKRCTFRCSPWSNTFFDGLTCKIPVMHVLDIIYWWSKKEPVHRIVEETGLAENTVIDYCNFLREVSTIIKCIQ